MIKRVLIVGYGSIGKRHARLARDLFPYAKIIILRHKASKKIKYQYVDYCVTNLIDAIKFKPQIAVIANPASQHVNVAYPLAKLGVHLLIEKPISNSAKDVLKLVNTCKSKKSILMVGYNLRFMDSLKIPLEHGNHVNKIKGSGSLEPEKVREYLQTILDNWPEEFPKPNPD